MPAAGAARPVWPMIILKTPTTRTGPTEVDGLKTASRPKACREIPWRRPIASLNYLLTSHVWRQDHNCFSHQDPGFIDYVCNKKAEIVRVYLPPNANSLLFVTDHCLRSWNCITSPVM